MEEFLQLFSYTELTPAIWKIAHKFFEEEIWFADGLYLTARRKKDLQYFILDKKRCEENEHKFLLFAQATHPGSSYAFYKAPGTHNADEWPVLVLGDEGGAVVLAKNIFDLLRFWTLNTVQPYINSADYRSFQLMYNPSCTEDNTEFKNWIQHDYGISSLQSIEEVVLEIIDPAMHQYQALVDEAFSQ